MECPTDARSRSIFVSGPNFGSLASLPTISIQSYLGLECDFTERITIRLILQEEEALDLTVQPIADLCRCLVINVVAAIIQSTKPENLYNNDFYSEVVLSVKTDTTAL